MGRGIKGEVYRIFSHRHYSNPFRPDRLITFSWHPGDVPRGIIADIVPPRRDLGITRDQFYVGEF